MAKHMRTLIRLLERSHNYGERPCSFRLGVGGIEAEAAMLGQPISMLVPDVVGFHLEGKLPEVQPQRSGPDNR